MEIGQTRTRHRYIPLFADEMNMEPAERVFARDFTAARHTVDDRDDPYVVTPGGAWCRRLFIVGALTARRESGDVMQARVADPTGTFQVSADWQNPSALETLGYIEPPAFVAVTGQAILIGSGPRAYAAVDVEAINAVDRTVRDIWVLTTADVTLDRLEGMQAALALGSGGGVDDRIATAIGLYGTREEEIQGMAGMVRTALASVLPDITLDDITPTAGRDRLLAAIGEEGGEEGIPLEDAVALGVRSGLTAQDARAALEELLAEGEFYQPAPGILKLI